MAHRRWPHTYLKRIELLGFKSFPERISLEFTRGVTAIVGPNGSGKSNISDAVRWALGEQSLRSLRGGRSEDVIFSGTDSRKPSGLAEVTLVIDNQDRGLPIEFGEVSVTRRHYRSGESEFLINKNPCRLKDISELFFDTGIGREGYTIVGQGKVDEILSSKPEDRRGIFEEAAGITKHKVRKAEAERKLEATSQNLLRIDDIIVELEAQLETLKEQEAAARQYLKLKDELRSIEVGVHVAAIGRLLAETEKNARDMEAAQAELSRHEAEQAGIESAQRARSERLALIDARQAELHGELRALDARVSDAAAHVRLNEERAAQAGAGVERLAGEIERAGERRAGLASELGSCERKLSYLDGEIARYGALLDEKKAVYEKAVAALGAAEAEAERRKREADGIQERYYETRNAAGALAAELGNYERNIAALDRAIAASEAEIGDMGLARGALAEAKSSQEARVAGLRASLQSLMSRQEGEAERRRRLEAAAAGKAGELGAARTRAKILEDMERNLEGFHSSVRRVLARCREDAGFARGILGAVASLVDVPKEYEVAIGLALGPAQQNIVTLDEAAAERAIDFLKRTRGGRVTFLPLTTVRERGLPEAIASKLAGRPGVVGVASSLVRHGPELQKPVSQLLGRTVVVRSLDDALSVAREFRYAFRVVTLEGEIITTGGAVTGGSVEDRDAGLLGRRREIPELKAAAERLSRELAELAALQEEAAQAEGSIAREAAGLEEALGEARLAEADAGSRLARHDERASESRERRGLQMIDRAEAEKARGELDEGIARKNAEAEELAGQASQAREELARLGESNKEGQRARDGLMADISGYNVSVASIAEARKAARETADRLRGEIADGGRGVTRREAEIARLKESIAKLALEDEALRAEERNLGTERQGMGLQMESLAAEKAALREESQAAQDSMAELASRRAGLQREASRLEAKGARAEAELEGCRTRLWEDYELTYHNALEVASKAKAEAAIKAKAEAAAKGGGGKPPSDAATARRAAALREGIRALGYVNVMAIEEYAATRARHAKMAAQRDDLVEAGEKLRAVVAEMNEAMRLSFQERFALINENFNAVFTQMFSGGQARLALSGEKDALEAGVDIEIQFPGKRMQNLMLYSGGERAMTAIALIFAMLRLRPAPFCLLDEIESALDEANLERFTRFIQGYSGDTQFIMVTHRKGTMVGSNALYGVTMQERGVSAIVSLRLGD